MTTATRGSEDRTLRNATARLRSSRARPRLPGREYPQRATVADVMTTDPVTVTTDDTIHAAAARLADYRISGAPVVDEGKLVGIITEADLIRAAFPPATIDRGGSLRSLLAQLLRGRVAHLAEDATVESVMTDRVKTVGPRTTVSDAAATMDGTGLRRLPVIDEEGNLIGIVSRADLVATIARTDEELRADVLDALMLAGEESVEEINAEVHAGVVTLRGTADRKTTKQVALNLAAEVPGVIDVIDRLEFRSDDTIDLPRQKDPWANGPLVKHVA